MKILFVSHADPRDIRTFSGLAARKVAVLESLGHQVEPFVLDHSLIEYYGKVKWHLKHKLTGRIFQMDTDPIVRHFWSKRATRRLKGVSFDMVFSWHPFQGALIKTDKPFVYWYDATFQDSWPTYFPNCTPDTARNGIALENKILHRCAAAIYPSDWARLNAIKHYGVDPSKVHTLPYGSNLPLREDEQTLQSLISQRPRRWAQELRLLFVGVVWERKGGPTVVAVTRELNRIGIRARLTVVGCTPPIAPEDAPFVHVLGRLDQRSPEDVAKLQSLYLDSDFFIMLSGAESYGVVYCEAMARGVPSIAANIGGVGMIVRNGQTGMLFEHGPAIASQIVEYLSQAVQDPEGYLNMARQCLHLSKTLFNWDVAPKRLDAILQNIFQGSRG